MWKGTNEETEGCDCYVMCRVYATVCLSVWYIMLAEIVLKEWSYKIMAETQQASLENIFVVTDKSQVSPRSNHFCIQLKNKL